MNLTLVLCNSKVFVFTTKKVQRVRLLFIIAFDNFMHALLVTCIICSLHNCYTVNYDFYRSEAIFTDSCPTVRPYVRVFINVCMYVYQYVLFFLVVIASLSTFFATGHYWHWNFHP